MTELKSKPRLAPSLRLSLKDAAAYSIMVGSGEAYLSAFVLALGFSAVSAGLITTVPVVVGSTIQLLFMWIYNHLTSYRRWVIWSARAQSFILFTLATLPYWAPRELSLIYIFTSLYWACSFSAGPAWNAWMGALVPKRMRITFFAQRTRQAQIFTYLTIFTSGLLLYLAENLHLAIHCFAALFGVAAVARLTSAHYIQQQLDSPREEIEKIMLTSTGFLKRMQDPKLIIILIYLFVLQLSVYIAAPYFSPYMLKELQLNYAQYMLLSSTTFLSRIFLYPLIQKWADRYGPLKLIWFGTLALTLTPYLWTLSENYFYLLTLQVFSGAAWGMQELGLFLLLLDRFPSKERSSILTVANFLSSMGMLLGSLLGSRIMIQSEFDTSTYFLVFTISTLCRLSAALALPFLEEKPIRHRLLLFWRVVGFRPNLGAMLKPILYIQTRRHKKRPERKPE